MDTQGGWEWVGGREKSGTELHQGGRLGDGATFPNLLDVQISVGKEITEPEPLTSSRNKKGGAFG